jgi:hypothetical protein
MSLPVQLGHLTQNKGETAILGQHEIGQSFAVDIECAGGDLMQRGLPDMVARLIHQVDMPRADFPAELGSQLEASGAAADDHYFVRFGLHFRPPISVCRAV